MNRLISPIKKIALVATLLSIVACSGGSGQEVQTKGERPRNDGDNTVIYNSSSNPSPATDDVLAFKLNVWDNLAAKNRCGSCHIVGGTSPEFVRGDDINLAYAAANSLVDLTVPSSSRLVQKVSTGHNCWSSDPAVCGEIITNYIEAWANSSGASSNVIVLTAPPVHPVEDSLSYGESSADDFATEVHEDLDSSLHAILQTNCGNCHAENTALQQQPYIGSDDKDVAFDAARKNINIDSPVDSRLVTRLAREFHNCWTTCDQDSITMEKAITAFVGTLEETVVDPDLKTSLALGLTDGIVAASGGRVETNVIALYEFKNSSLDTVFDTSGVDPALDLNLSGNVQRVGGWGIRINDGKAQGSTNSSKKLYDLIRATEEYSIEAWVVPSNVTQDGPARILSYSGGPEIRNFTLGQTLYNYNFMNRSSATDGNGMPMVSTADADEVLQATLQHVVASYSPLTGTSIYVNGELVAEDVTSATSDADSSGEIMGPTIGSNLSGWDDTFAFVLGQEVDGEHLWQGVIRFLAIHNRTLTQDDIQKNYAAGVGEKFYLLFGVSEHMDFPEAYVVLQVEQFDDSSYLFSNPFFISLGDTVPSSDIVLKGMRIGINGREVDRGQSYANLDVTINSSNYSTDTGTTLSELGAVVALEKGADLDQFFLTFDRIGNSTYTRVEAETQPPVEASGPEEQSVLALRHFDEINATIAQMTQTPLDNLPASVVDVYTTVKQQLPTIENIDTFLAAHQAGIMQLSVAYCTALVNDTTRRAVVFDGVDFGGDISAATLDAIVDPLLSGLTANEIDLGDGSSALLATQPVPADLRAHLSNLADAMSAAETDTTVIALCAATAGSAVMLLQ